MRLSRESLIKAARDYAAQRAKVSRRIICIYLTGSVLGDAPLLGGTTDIDLFIIHDSEPVQPREVVRLSDDVTLDISHQDQAVYRQPRHLRASRRRLRQHRISRTISRSDGALSAVVRGECPCIPSDS